MSRKEALRNMLSGPKLPTGNSELPMTHVRSGAVGAMGRSLGQIAGAAQQARAMVASGAAVIEIAADQLVPSFVADRLQDEGPDYQRLVEAIRESGQRSPVLARPHPDGSDRYQIAFGHRRVRVLAGLGRPVRTVVQELTDEEVVVIQGQENAARTDLSYIERGLFALTLEEAGYDRRIIMASLGMEKTQLSKLLGLAHLIPRHVAKAIGPAPRAGRPRWAALADAIARKGSGPALEKLFGTASFRDAESDDRFSQAFAALAAPSVRETGVILNDEQGRPVASIARRKGHVTIAVNEKIDPAFGAFLESRLADIYRAFVAGRDEFTALSNSDKEG